jgi:asparagine synthase (glutamine-hydrolysing)
MCGICGIYNRDGRPVVPEKLEKMMAVIAHRGPDGQGFYVNGEIGLGHRRLSIIDLGGGAQPMTNEDDTLQMIFNGEIYNYVELTEELKSHGHKFKTHSDTEVILHAYEQWGHDCVGHFNGIFAFALWDIPKQQLFLARDHLGVKPLYYVELGEQFLFGSEIKTLLSDPDCPRQVDLNSLSEFFSLRYVPSPGTMFQKIKKLPPGHWMTVDSSKVQIQRYWNWTPNLRTRVNEGELLEEYRSLVEDAVRIQMRSDVPVGLFLSSGIDSGCLLALMSGLSGKPIRTFTIGFEQGEAHNETDDARSLAKQFGADHDEMMVSPKDYTNYFERYMWDLEEPVGNETSVAFYFVSLIAGRKVKVVLSGQGADEPWAGYHRYIGVKLSGLYSKLPSMLTKGLVPGLIDRYAKNERLRRGAVSLQESDVLTRFVKIYSFFNTEMKSQLFQPWVKEQISCDGQEAREALSRLHSDVKNLDPLTQMLYIDTRANLPDDLLMVGDKTSMANSLESRVPFLDYRLVEFIESLPNNLKLRGFQGKYLHKKAIEKWLPRNVVHRKKKGFDNPIDQWLRGSMKHFVKECLLSDSSGVGQFFEKKYLRTLIEEHEAGRHNHLRHIYLLIAFELWYQQFITKPIPALV